MGKIIKKDEFKPVDKLHPDEQFGGKSDDYYTEKLRKTFIIMADNLSEQVKQHIMNVYNDEKLHKIYKNIRDKEIYEKGGKYRRKIIEFPDGYIYDFCNAFFTPMYGSDWLSNNKAINHDLVKPWWVVNKI